MSFIISKSCIHSIFKYSCKNQYLMLVVLSQFKIHTTHRVTTIGYTFTISQSCKLTFSLTPLIFMPFFFYIKQTYSRYMISQCKSLISCNQFSPNQISKQTPLLNKIMKCKSQPLFKFKSSKILSKFCIISQTIMKCKSQPPLPIFVVPGPQEPHLPPKRKVGLRAKLLVPRSPPCS